MPVALNGVRGFALLALHCPSEGIASGCLAARGRLKTGHAHLNAYDPSQNEPLRPSRFVRAADGKFYEQVVQRPESTLQHFYLRSEDLDGLQRIPAFPLTTAQLANYNLKYLGKEQVDEVNCYIFQVKPKILERQKAHFDGVVWVDSQYVEVVKTYGQWMTDLGPMRVIPQFPFSLFETYRENVQGKYWFPDYSRSDDTLDLKGQQIPVRIVIKWTDFKPLPAAPQVAAPAATPPAPASP